MKFWMFHLMPWPYLPNDFDEKYDTAWVTCPNALFDPERAVRTRSLPGGTDPDAVRASLGQAVARVG